MNIVVVVCNESNASHKIKVEVQNLHDMYLEECHIRLNTACLTPREDESR